MIAGVDEVGRGPLAGPVVAAVVVLDAQDPMYGAYRDSKRLSERKRRLIYHHIRRHARAYALASASVEEIDRLNILHATFLAMRRAMDRLPIKPDRALVDGHHAPSLGDVAAEPIVGGDDKVQCIAAASIVAKVVRDRLMNLMAVRYPEYGFDTHKGYGTKGHLAAIKNHGITPLHRRSFAPVRRLLE
ncbi:MAG: ribonuclease HII [Zetaproteobacteria bacterium]|nr:MAG: ribonuclease HII [Zetaproteobacteria bacterium]